MHHGRVHRRRKKKKKCKGPHPPLTGQPPALPLWVARAMVTLHWHAWLGSLPHSAGVSQSSPLSIAPSPGFATSLDKSPVALPPQALPIASLLTNPNKTYREDISEHTWRGGRTFAYGRRPHRHIKHVSQNGVIQASIKKAWNAYAPPPSNSTQAQPTAPCCPLASTGTASTAKLAAAANIASGSVTLDSHPIGRPIQAHTAATRNDDRNKSGRSSNTNCSCC